MSSYRAPERDLRFVLHELLNVTETLHLESDAETINQILEAAGSFASDVLSPLNPVGDREGCQLLQTGVVRTPTGFKSAYEAYVAGGWGALSADESYGGQGLPLVVKASVAEIFSGANMAWNSYGGMTNAAYKCLAANGSQDQKEKFLPKLATGEWGGTMCLTEPHCGTDLGLLRTRAVPQPDGSYFLHGTKIFISGGDQDLTENVIHLVLARWYGRLPPLARREKAHCDQGGTSHRPASSAKVEV